MKTLSLRHYGTRAPESVGFGWTGPGVIPILGASGGAGTSTLCALLAGSIAESIGSRERRTLVVDAVGSPGSPWPDWVAPGIDPALGEEGIECLSSFRPPPAGFPGSMLRRCGAAVRGLDGTLVLTSLQGGGPTSRDLSSLTDAFTVSLIDLPATIYPSLAAQLRDLPGGILLAIGGTADGIGAGLRSARRWAALGLPPSRIRPVVIANGAGALPPRARARLALLDSNTQPVVVVPFDPAIARRGLAEALACGAIGAPTRIAIRRIAVALADRPAPTPAGTDDLALFQLPLPDGATAPQNTPSPVYEGTLR